jgi:hypothetical protein
LQLFGVGVGVGAATTSSQLRYNDVQQFDCGPGWPLLRLLPPPPQRVAVANGLNEGHLKVSLMAVARIAARSRGLGWKPQISHPMQELLTCSRGKPKSLMNYWCKEIHVKIMFVLLQLSNVEL